MNGKYIHRIVIVTAISICCYYYNCIYYNNTIFNNILTATIHINKNCNFWGYLLGNDPQSNLERASMANCWITRGPEDIFGSLHLVRGR